MKPNDLNHPPCLPGSAIAGLWVRSWSWAPNLSTRYGMWAHPGVLSAGLNTRHPGEQFQGQLDYLDSICKMQKCNSNWLQRKNEERALRTQVSEFLGNLTSATARSGCPNFHLDISHQLSACVFQLRWHGNSPVERQHGGLHLLFFPTRLE